MSANTDLQGGGALTLEQRIARVENALRGGPPVVDSQGAPTDGAIDLGSAANTWRRIYAEQRPSRRDQTLISVPLAEATPGYAFDASGDFDWPYRQHHQGSVPGWCQRGKRERAAAGLQIHLWAIRIKRIWFRGRGSDWR